jgi:hypothetical protein
MKSSRSSASRRNALLAFAAFALLPVLTRAADVPALLDDFSDPVRSSLHINRIVVTDTTAGGASQLHQTSANGVFTAAGEIAPPRGQLGWASMILLLSPTGAPADLSKYQGIKVRVRVREGYLSVTANSSEITNFDYHAAPLPRKPGELQEVRIAFRDMKRGWSEQTPLNLATITSVNLVAYDFQKGAFAYDVDEIGFY